MVTQEVGTSTSNLTRLVGFSSSYTCNISTEIVHSATSITVIILSSTRNNWRINTWMPGTFESIPYMPMDHVMVCSKKGRWYGGYPSIFGQGSWARLPEEGIRQFENLARFRKMAETKEYLRVFECRFCHAMFYAFHQPVVHQRDVIECPPEGSTPYFHYACGHCGTSFVPERSLVGHWRYYCMCLVT